MNGAHQTSDLFNCEIINVCCYNQFVVIVRGKKKTLVYSIESNQPMVIYSLTTVVLNNTSWTLRNILDSQKLVEETHNMCFSFFAPKNFPTL